MTTTVSRDSTSSISYSQFPSRKCLLPRKKLEAIASCLGSISPAFTANYRDIPDEGLLTLQNDCFTHVFEMCERGEWGAIQKVEDVISGIRDSDGNTIFYKYICHGKEESCDTSRDNASKTTKTIDTRLYWKLSFSDERCTYPLHLAARLGRSAKFLKSIIDMDYSTREMDHKGRLPIHIAVKKGHTDILEILYPIEIEGFNIFNIPYFSNKKKMDLTPISLAILKGHILCLDELMRAEKIHLSSIRIGHEGRSLLHLAVSMNKCSMTNYLMLNHLLTKYFEETRYLLNAPDDKGYTPIILAVILGDITALAVLIKKGANLESYDFKGRTAVHHAVMQRNREMLDILAAHGANLKRCDLDGKSPIELAQDDEFFFKFLYDFISRIDYLRRHYSHNFALYPPENLVFMGGGPKCLAYIGAIQALENQGRDSHVKRIAGSSSGAMTATLLAIGCNADEILDLSRKTPGTDFLDHPYTSDSSIQSNPLLQRICSTISQWMTNDTNTVELLTGFGLKLTEEGLNFTGLCEGDRFLTWIEEEIQKKTSIAYCTFGELADLIAREETNPQGRPFKHLHVFVTKIAGEGTAPVHLSSEGHRRKNIIISQAIRASMSIPILFKPYILICKEKKENGQDNFYTENRTLQSDNYEQLAQTIKTHKEAAEPSYIDGGLIRNFPIDAFDKSRYIPNAQYKGSQANPRTLGFFLYSPHKEAKPKNVATVRDLIEGIYHLFSNVDSLLNQSSWAGRVIELDNQGIQLQDFHTTPDKGLGKQAIAMAQKTTEAFFQQQEEEIKGIRPSSSENAHDNTQHVQRSSDKPNSLTPRDLEQNIETLYHYVATGNDGELQKFIKAKKREELEQIIHAANQIPILFQIHKSSTLKILIANGIGLTQLHRKTQKTLLYTLAKNGDAESIDLVTHICKQLTTTNMNPASRAIILDQELISSQINPNTGKPRRKTALIIAAEKNNYEIVQLLLKAGANFWRPIDGFTPLNYAPRSIGRKESHQLLCNAWNKASFSKRELLTTDPQSGKTLLHCLVEANAEEPLKEFIKQAKEKEVLQQLIALENQAKEAILFKTRRPLILKILIANGINLTQTHPETQKTLLYTLAKNGDAQSIDLVEYICVQVRTMDPESRAAILDQELISTQTNSITGKPYRKTALIIAAEKNNHEIVRLLIAAGADFFKLVTGLSPLNVAPTTAGRKEAYQILQQAYHGYIWLHSPREQLNVLRIYSLHNKPEAAEHFIHRIQISTERNRDYIGINCRDAKGQTVLHYAVRHNCKNITRLLITYLEASDLNVQDFQNQTPLHCARDTEMVEMLVLRGANPSIKDNANKTPRAYAELAGYKTFAQFLEKCEKWHKEKYNFS